MDIIRDDEALRERMQLLFGSIDALGFGFEITDVSYEMGTATLEFSVKPESANQLGSVQGGVVVTMLDAWSGISGAVKSGGVLAMPLAEMKTTFIRSVPLERLVGKGETL